jgi:hypothetical protein
MLDRYCVDCHNNAEVTANHTFVDERLARHYSIDCHYNMDPVGFALENFDAVGDLRRFAFDNIADAFGGSPLLMEE